MVMLVTEIVGLRFIIYSLHVCIMAVRGLLNKEQRKNRLLYDLLHFRMSNVRNLNK